MGLIAKKGRQEDEEKPDSIGAAGGGVVDMATEVQLT